MYYTVYYDQSNSTWVTLEPKVASKTYTTAVLLTMGRLYSFQVQAINSVGVSILSS